MAKKNDVFKCELCGNIVSMLHVGGGELVCCGQPMTLSEPNTVDAAQEKHVPVIEKSDHGFVVKVGALAHPMEAAHYIQWIEVVADGKVYRTFLNPGEAPEATFCIDAQTVVAYAYCNLHGYWKADG